MSREIPPHSASKTCNLTEDLAHTEQHVTQKAVKLRDGPFRGWGVVETGLISLPGCYMVDAVKKKKPCCI